MENPIQDTDEYAGYVAKEIAPRLPKQGELRDEKVLYRVYDEWIDHIQQGLDPKKKISFEVRLSLMKKVAKFLRARRTLKPYRNGRPALTMAEIEARYPREPEQGELLNISEYPD